MNKILNKVGVVVVLVSGLFLSSAASATVIEFEDGLSTEQFYEDAQYNESGYVFEVTLGNYFRTSDYGSQMANQSGDVGFWQNVTTDIDIYRTDGGSFDFNSIDFGVLFGVGATELSLTGTYAAGGSVTRTIAGTDVTDTGALFPTFVFDSSWAGLNVINMSRISGNFGGIDNVTFDQAYATSPIEVSAPATLGLLSLGLLFFLRRKVS